MRLIDLINSPWAITPEKHGELASFYQRHMGGEKIDIKGIQDQCALLNIGPPSPDERPYQIVNGVAVIPVTGMLTRQLTLMSWIFGGMSMTQIGQAVQQAAADDAVNAILLDIDSPGGSVAGTQELAEIVSNAREQKTVYAYTGGTMASAAYWIGSAASRLFIGGDTTMVGSIGILSTHVDSSKQKEMDGLKVTEVAGGRWKDKPSAVRPLDDDDRAVIQYRVDALYQAFVNAVAANRGVSEETVISDMAEGRVFVGRDAIEAGLVDGVATFPEAIEAAATAEPQGSLPDDVAAAVPADGDPQATTEEPQMDYSALTLDDLKANRPDLVDAISADSAVASATAERSRIQAVESMTMPGHEELIATMKFDGKTTGQEAAVKILQAEQAAGAAALAALEDDAPNPAATAEPAKPAATPKVDADAPLAERAKADWDSNAALRSEFGGNFDGYLAFREAEEGGQVRFLRNGSKENAA